MVIKDDLKIIYDYQKELSLLRGIESLLHWDMETYMPSKGIEDRSEKSSYISSLIHKKITSDVLFEALSRLIVIDSPEFSDIDKVVIKKFYRDVSKTRKLPEEFIVEISKAKSLAFVAWQNAREKNDFSLFEPHLKKIVELKRKEAKYIGLPGHIYNSLLDDYEEGMTVEILNPKFEKLKGEIVSLLQKIKSSDVYENQNVELLKEEFDRDKQVLLAKEVMKKIGLGNDFSRVDFAEHPFATHIGKHDVRITTNIRSDPLFSFHSTVHESGHALYESNFPDEFNETVLYDAPSLGLHESQSRFWEIMLGTNRPFWEYFFKRFDEVFGLNNNFEKWFKEVNYISPSFIRIESDEVHYPLHVILRYEIEKGLIDGSIEVKDLPKIWNAKMEELIGIVPRNDKEGVLQDVHWSQGYFGYFPTYILGSIYAAQIYFALLKQNPEIEAEIRKGDFSKIGMWLKDKIHKYGRSKFAEDIIREVTGEGLNPEVYMNYLNKKYSELYGFG